MIFSTLKELLVDALKISKIAANNKNSMPILQTVRIDSVDEKHIQITATNLEITIVKKVPANVYAEGSFTVPIKTFYDIISTISGSTSKIDFEYNHQTQILNVKYEKGSSTIKCLDPEDYPPTPSYEKFSKVFVDKLGQITKNMQYMNCYSRDFSRPILQAIHISGQENAVRIASADGYRLSYGTIPVYLLEDFNINVYAHQLVQVSRLLPEDKDIDYMVHKDTLALCNEDIQIYVLSLSGRYPDIQSVIPKKNVATTIVNAKDMAKAVKSSMVFARDNANSISMKFENNQIVVTGKSAERGDVESVVNGLTQGDPLTVSVNGMFLSEILSNFSDSVVFKLNGEEQPLCLHEENSNLEYVLMPMSR